MNDSGWELSPLYDVNPDIYGDYLSLNVDENSSLISFDLAIKSAQYYGVEKEEAESLVNMIVSTVEDNWQKIAKKYGISWSEIERMKPAFSQNKYIWKNHV